MKYKIAFLHSEMIVGGAEKVLLNMLEALDYSEYDVTLFLPDDSGGFFSKIPSTVKIQFYSVGNEPTVSEIVRNALKNRKFSDIIRLFFYRLLQRIYVKDWYKETIYFYQSLPKISETDFDGVFIYDDKAQRDIYYASRRLKYKKRVTWVHSSFQEEVSQDFIIPKEYRSIDKFFCVSDSVRQNLEKYFPYVKGKTEVFYNLLDVDEIKQKAQETPDIDIGNQDLLSVGRLAVEKNHVMIPETVAILKQHGFQGKWYIIGEGGMRAEIEKQIGLYHVENDVILLGERKNPYPFMKQCGIFVQTSTMEGFCTTTLEAKVLGKPVVTTDAPGMREQFRSGENGIIVDEMTPLSVAEGIVLLLSNDGLRAIVEKNVCMETMDNKSELSKLEKMLSV